MSGLKQAIMMRFDQLIYSKIPSGQKEALSNLLTEKQKNWVKKLIGAGTFHQHIRLIADYREKLTTQGFKEKALTDLMDLYHQNSHPHLKSLAAYEIILFHGNEGTPEGYKKMLTYAREMLSVERDPDRLRKVIIMIIEGLSHTGEREMALKIADRLLRSTNHPDAILARSNLSDSKSAKELHLKQLYDQYQEVPIVLDANEHAVYLYDELTTPEINRQSPVKQTVMVSIIMPAYNAADNIQVAIESLLKQTWVNLELIIVDDCSTDQTLDVCRLYEKEDSRVKVLQTPENSGAYTARNVGLRKAEGELITVNDSDDWSHPRKIEIQVEHLMKHPKIVGNFSLQARLSNDFTFYRRGKMGEYIFKNFSSLMFRKDEVLDQLGYWDSVRFAGDSEFVQRILTVFGEHALSVVETAPMSFQRQAAGSLTASSAFGYPGYFMGARKEYRESHQFHHRYYPNDLYYQFPQQKRPFPAPYPMWPERKKGIVRNFGSIIAADFRVKPEGNRMLMEMMESWKRLSESKGLVQVYNYHVSHAPTVEDAYREMIDGKNISAVVYGEEVSCSEIIVPDFHVMLENQMYLPKVHAENISVLLGDLSPIKYGSNENTMEAIQVADRFLKEWLGDHVVWYPENEEVLSKLYTMGVQEQLNLTVADQFFYNRL